MAQQPTITVSTVSCLPWRLNSYQILAAEIGAAGVDLDLTTWIGRATLGKCLAREDVDIHSVWLSGTDLASRNTIEKAIVDDRKRPLRVVVRLRAGTLEDDLSIVRSAYKLKSRYSWISGLSVAVPATALDGGRTHLTRLRMLGRFLEEWELDLGVDLNRQTDSRWEAEAALLACGPRLKVIRITYPLHTVVDQKHDVLNRSLSTLAEMGFRGTLSLAPTLPLWLSWHRPSVVRDLVMNRSAVTRIFLERKLALRESYESHLI